MENYILYGGWAAYLVLHLLLTSAKVRHGLHRALGLPPERYVVLTQLTSVLLLLPLLYFHFHFRAPALVTFGLVIRLGALVLMVVGGIIVVQAMLRQHYTIWTGRVRSRRVHRAWRSLQLPATVGVLLLVTGAPIYWPTVPNFLVASMVALHALARYLMRSPAVVEVAHEVEVVPLITKAPASMADEMPLSGPVTRRSAS